MPYPHEHSCRLIDPAEVDVVGRGTRRHDGKEYSIIFAKPKAGGSVEQAYRYDKDVWSVEEARRHCEAHGGILFEPATGSLEGSFRWLTDIEVEPEPGMVKIAPAQVGVNLKGYNLMRDELRRAARTWINKPIYLGKTHDEKVKVGELLWSEFEDDRIEQLGRVDLPTWKRIKNGEIEKVSVEADFIRRLSEYTDGVTPRGLVGVGVLLLEPGAKPADPKAFVEIYEGLLGTLSPETQTQTESGQVDKGLSDVKGVEWTTAYINDLDDSAFAYIAPGGKKDDEGKTVPRTLRHLPHHDASGKVDLPRLRNAVARLPQTSISAGARRQALRHLCGHARELKLEFPSCQALGVYDTLGLTPKGSGEEDQKEEKLGGEYEKMSTNIEELKATIKELEAKIRGFEDRIKEQEETIENLTSTVRNLKVSRGEPIDVSIVKPYSLAEHKLRQIISEGVTEEE